MVCLHVRNFEENFTFSLSDDSTSTADHSPERDATLKAGLEALLRVKELEKVSVHMHDYTIAKNHVAHLLCHIGPVHF